MAIKINGTTVIDDSRNALSLGTGYFSGDVTTEGTGALQISVGGTSQRPGSPAAGMIRLNSDTGNFEIYTTAWNVIPNAGGDISGNAATASQIYLNESTDPDSWWNLTFAASGSANSDESLYQDDGAFTVNPSQNLLRILGPGSTYTAIGDQNVSFNYGGVDSQGDLTATTLTANRTWTLPNKTGTVAMTSDITGATVGTATSSTAGVVKLGDDTEQSVAANAVTATASRTYAVQLNANDQMVVNVPWVDTDTTYSLPLATATTRGGVELFSNTDNPTAANAVTSTAGRTYGIQLNSSNQMVVNVPWTDTNTNTTYTADEDTLTLTGTTFSIKADGVSSDELASVVTLIIYDSSGSALKTLYGAGS